MSESQWRTYSYWENHRPNRELGDLLGRWRQNSKGMWPVSQTRTFTMHSIPSGGQPQDWRKGGLIGPSNVTCVFTILGFSGMVLSS